MNPRAPKPAFAFGACDRRIPRVACPRLRGHVGAGEHAHEDVGTPPRTRRLAPTLLAIALGFSLTLASAQDKPPDVKPKGVVPFEMLATNHIVVRAKINGK